MSKEKYIWVFGENLGSTANNNSYYFWKHVVNIEDEIEKYLVLEKTESNKKAYDKLSKHEQKYVLWKNSKRHYQKYFDADLFFVTLSYKDITPDKLLFKNMEMELKKPLIYLQHGTIGMKMVYYSGDAYWNNMFKFFIFTDDEYKYLREYNRLADYQLYNAKYHPRYGELLRKDEKYENKNQILWFITWREYFGVNAETDLFISYIKQVVDSEELRQYLKKTKKLLKICVHQFFNENTFKDLFKYSEKGLFEIVHPSEVDVMDELNKSELLITDYSSVAYDFTFMNRPVILFQPDIQKYGEERDFYCEIDDLRKHNTERPKQLIDAIINENYDVNPFFKKSFPEMIDYEAIKGNKHIDKIYNDFKKMQKNKITFIGWDFFSPTEVVNRTMDIAENLMKEGYLVDLVSLKKPELQNNEIPFGLNITSLDIDNDPSMRNKLHKLQHKSDSNYSYLKYDYKKDDVHPYAGYFLKDLMKHSKSKTIISTRESLHLFLNDCSSDFVKNRIFIRNPYDYGDHDRSKDLIEEIKKLDLKNNILLSKKDTAKFEELNINIDDYIILKDDFIIGRQIADLIDLDSDALDSNMKPVKIDEKILIEDKELRRQHTLLHRTYIPEKTRYVGISIIELNEKDSEEIKNIIEFGEYLKDNDIKNISLDVVGDGDYSDYFMDLIEEHDLFSFINFRGFNHKLYYDVQIHDFLLDLSPNPRFNTNYFLGLLNYKKIFCIKNDETSEILKDIPNSYFSSFDELCSKINNLPEISIKDLRDNYVKTYEKYNENDILDDILPLIR